MSRIRQTTADEVFGQLLTMGFDIEQATSATRTGLSQLSISGQNGMTLLEAALQYLLAVGPDETRAVLCKSSWCWMSWSCPGRRLMDGPQLAY